MMLGGRQVHRPNRKRVKLGLQYKESNGKSFLGPGNIKPQNQEIYVFFECKSMTDAK
jgi:hypothetical protein